ncbi:hypothetical protein GCM10022406_35770 [Hymenobacter algoricola]|uniref:Uncharacterized protein n=1 Tax=Hymenobacter algoricola TaxID=486267 RepID=A0ABP7NPA7_9BACT
MGTSPSYTGLRNWNATPARGLATDMGESSAEGADLLEFALTSDALLLFNPIGMSRYDFEFLPDETYTFPFERIQLQPRWQQLQQQRLAVPRAKRQPN